MIEEQKDKTRRTWRHIGQLDRRRLDPWQQTERQAADPLHRSREGEGGRKEEEEEESDLHCTCIRRRGQKGF